MADTYTTNLNLTKPEVGGSDNTWGTKLNANFDSIDALFTTGPALLLSKGGTEATTAAGARTNLGLGTLATQNADNVSVGTLTTTSNVGIKTSSPTAALDVNGSLKASSLTLSDTLSVSSTSSFSGTVSTGSTSVSTQLTVPSTASVKDSSGNRVVGFGVGIKRNNSLTLTVSAETTLSWEAEDFDDANMWSSGSNVSLPKNGIYAVSGQVQLQAASGSGLCHVKLYRSGVLQNTMTCYVDTSNKQYIFTFVVRETGAPGTYTIAIQNTLTANVTLNAPSSVKVTCLGTF